MPDNHDEKTFEEIIQSLPDLSKLKPKDIREYYQAEREYHRAQREKLKNERHRPNTYSKLMPRIAGLFLLIFLTSIGLYTVLYVHKSYSSYNKSSQITEVKGSNDKKPAKQREKGVIDVIDDITNLMESFFLWLQVVMAVTFGVIAYLQWRDAQRQATQQETFTSYVESSTDFMSNASEMIDAMTRAIEFNDKIKKEVEDLQQEKAARTEEKAQQRRAEQDVKSKINQRVLEFVGREHRNEAQFSTRLRKEMEELEELRKDAKNIIRREELSNEFNLLYGQYCERVLTKIDEAIQVYTLCLDSKRLKNMTPAIKASFYRNRGLGYIYTNKFDEAISDLSKAANSYPQGEDLNLRLICTAKLISYRRNQGHYTLKSILDEFEHLDTILTTRVRCRPIHSTTFFSELRRWYASALMFDNIEIPNIEKARELLEWSQHDESHHLDWLKFRLKLIEGSPTDQNVLKDYHNTCVQEASVTTSMPDQITLRMKNLVYSIFGADTDYEKLFAELRGSIQHQYDKEDNTVLLVYSLLEETYVPLKQLKEQLDKLTADDIKNSIIQGPQSIKI